MRGLVADRLNRILDLVRERGFVRTVDLAESLGVSTVTIRQNVEELQDRGLLRRTHGGAAALPGGALDSAFASRQAEHRAEKARIGAAAAATVRAGETILIDAGTTAPQVAHHLPENRELTVVTPALNVALEAGSKAGVRVILCGGELNSRTLAVAGHQVEHVLAEVHADRLFLATYGVDSRRGLLERNPAGAQAKRGLIRAAREVVLVCDSSKFGATAPVVTASLSAIHGVITDAGIPRAFARLLRRRGLVVTIV